MTAQHAFARQLAMYLTHVALGVSLHWVAVAFGHDRSTVAYAFHLIVDRHNVPKVDNMLNQPESALRAAPAPRLFLASRAA